MDSVIFIIGMVIGMALGVIVAMILDAARMDDLVNENLQLKFEKERNV